jgi:predicted DNA-binding transcriptional regulator YafY
MMGRGRPKLTMTHRRRQVLLELADCVASGEKVTMAALARRCGLYDYRDARRIIRDLNRMGAVT